MRPHLPAASTVPQNCIVGYNNVRFDDEVTRNIFYRNFYDPYAWSWQHDNSRWDLLDVMRACYALRPEGIAWPENDEGLPSFRLEHLTVATVLNTRTPMTRWPTYTPPSPWRSW